MDGLDEPTETYPLLAGAAGFAFQAEPPPSPQEGMTPQDWLAPEDWLSSSPDRAEPPSSGSLPDPGPQTASGSSSDDPPTEEFALIPPPTPTRRPSAKLVAALVGVAALLGVTALFITTSSAPSTPPAATGDGPPAFEAGTFNLASSVTELNLTLGRPAGGPIGVTTPTGSGLAPATDVKGTDVRLTARPTGRTGSGRLDVQLDNRITWTITMTGGVRAAKFVLTGGAIRQVDLSGGADSVYLALPNPSEALPIRMSGGVRDWNIQTDGEIPVRVQADSGAGEVDLYGKRRTGIAQNTTLTSGAGSGLEVTAAAGFGSLAVSAQ